MIDKILNRLIFFLINVLTKRNRHTNKRIQPMSDADRKAWDALHEHWKKD